jgi:ferredoxin-nitrate reductase
MDFRDRDGGPLIKWADPEEAFEAWKACSRGRPCDYSQLSYDRLRSEGGIQWGGERLYGDGVFNTDTSYTETYGEDLLTGAAVTEEQHRALRPDGRAFLHGLEHAPPPEPADGEHPLLLTTGRTIYQFHTRTKTRRAPELEAAAPDAWVELHPDDAERLGVGEGDLVRLRSPRGTIEAPARLVPIRRGTVFVPFHYGSRRDDQEPRRAANELTLTAWDPVSKQPMFKLSALAASPVGSD